jgi:hypothetical protein
MSIEHDLDRAAKAQAIFDNPLYDDSFEQVRKAIHDQWESTPIRDQEGAHQLRLMLKLLGDVRANLDRVIADGKMARLELDNRRKSTLADFRR